MAVISLGLVVIILGFGILLLGTGWDVAYDWVTSTLMLIRSYPWETMGIGALLALLGVLLLARPQERREAAFVVPSRLGEVRITEDALRGIIARAALGIEGVRQVTASLGQLPEGLEITVSGELFPEVVLTETSEALQTAVKKDVENYTGIRVAEVKVLVRSLEGTRQARLK